jgi:Tfp pilus assembly protein PilO
VIPLRRVFDERRRIVLPLFVVLMANLALYALAVFPLSRRVAGAEERAGIARAALTAAAREHDLARATLEGKDRADRELRRFYAEVLPGNQPAARRITYLRLAQLAREAGLEPGRSAFEVEEIRESTLTRMGMSLDLQGDYSAIRRFVYLLETAPEFTIIENVTLASSEEGQLHLTLSLATYYRTPADGD